jgi:hypothetical protein
MDQPQEAQALGSNLNISLETELKAAWGIIYYTHIVFPITEVSTWKVLKVKRIVGTINQMPFRLALQSDGEGGSYIIVGKELRDKGKLEVGSKVSVTIQPDPNPDTVDLEEELLEVLAQDEEASEKFFALTAGKQRSLNYYIRSVKNIETRLKRSFEIVDKIKRNALS